MSLKDFDIGLVEYWEIEGKLINNTPLHIGVGGSRLPGEAIDNPVIRLPDGTPFIPGSTLKGVLRSIVEAYLRSVLISGNGSSSCYIFFQEEGLSLEEFDDVCSPFPRPGREQDKEKEEKARSVCINKKLFGGQEIASHTYIYDAYPVEGTDIKTMIKPGVAIDRFLGAVMPGALYNFEIIQPGVAWEFRMRIYGLDLSTVEENNETKCVREVLSLIFKTLEKGLVVGGKGSTGHGFVVLEEAEAIHRYFDPEKMDFIEEKHSLDEFIKILEGR